MPAPRRARTAAAHAAIAAIAATLLATAPSAPAAQTPASDTLRRRALPGFSAALLPGGAGMRVTAVAPEGTGAALGLRTGDAIVRIDGRPLTGPAAYGRAVRAMRAGQPVTMLVRRDGAAVRLAAAAVPYPREQVPGLDIEYGSVVSDYGDRVRTIVSRPAGRAGRLPAVLVVPWLSCSSVEMSIPTYLPGIRTVVHGVSAAGYAVWRVDRPGLGDSEGPDCSELDYPREVAAFRAAYAAMRASPGIDTGAVYLFGMSLGGSIAPQLAAEHPPRGIIVQGAHARTWYERILEFDRRRLALQGRAPSEIEGTMRALAELYAGFLLEKRTPAEVIRARPHLASAWEDEPEHQYGRPAVFYHGVQEANVVAAWERLAVPTLVLWGDHDFIMAREDQDLIVRTVNRRAPGRAELVVVPGMDHDMMRHRSLEDAFADRGGEVPREALEAVLAWLRRVGGGR